jgi:hypothetical protein
MQTDIRISYLSYLLKCEHFFLLSLVTLEHIILHFGRCVIILIFLDEKALSISVAREVSRQVTDFQAKVNVSQQCIFLSLLISTSLVVLLQAS